MENKLDSNPGIDALAKEIAKGYRHFIYRPWMSAEEQKKINYENYRIQMASLKECKIYTLSDPITKEVRYIGQTRKSLNERLGRHMYKGSENMTHKHAWLKSLKDRHLRPIIEIIEEGVWNEDEVYWIAQFKAWGFNLVNGNEGGKVHWDVNKARNKNSGFVSEESRKKISKALKGRKKSIEHIKKHKESVTGVPIIKNRKTYKLIKDGVESIIVGQKQAADFIGCHRTSITNVWTGKQSSVYGYKIERL